MTFSPKRNLSVSLGVQATGWLAGAQSSAGPHGALECGYAWDAMDGRWDAPFLGMKSAKSDVVWYRLPFKRQAVARLRSGARNKQYIDVAVPSGPCADFRLRSFGM